MFSGISRGNLGNVQRYITKLERERNARLAGLAANNFGDTLHLPGLPSERALDMQLEAIRLLG